ncbi:BTAD domain-containing putative transcriptional regulator [Nocardiopsis lambiniae]|uniref:BTAD domain-containing putative transcriptional regulator n=1 Tax=Nocardiopsis lambiniae TaxID=3075539 RepID=A0ABU2MBV6_9ACTN|nr:BTAD domain-containing putative transcriptional regulator [Nocardiopsis sp. DSM 44743]MDT0330165.1 BTAD domain-containing putative transcriptional regulator [Nocardiopsis sp. DSM 44743]
MRFGVLGSLTVWDSGGDQVPITETKVRAVLADLLAHHGRSVSAERLIEDLWGGRPPGRPLNTLQTKISQLRKALGAERVLRSPAGYRVRVEDDELDAVLFRRTVERADRTDDPGARGRLLAEALGLWRGPAFADFTDAVFVRAEAARLEELRVGAAERLAEARIETGEEDVAVAGLRELVEEHPLRERSHGLYMLALSRTGRQGEALRTFHELRVRLRDRLGIDPDPTVRDLYASILRQEPGATALPRVADRPRSNLPGPPTALIGRESESARVRAALSDPHADRLVTLTGPGGVGKTRLAIAVARSLTEDFPDGAWIVELAGMDRAATTADLAERVIATLGLCEGAADSAFELVEWLCGALRGRRCLVVLDNCEHVVSQVADLAGALLAADAGRLVVTTQEALDIPGETVFPLAPLTLPDSVGDPDEMVASSSAVRLFVERARAASPGFALTGENAPAVAAVCRRLDGVPLALELVAARLRAFTPEQIAAGLDDRFALPTGPGRGRPTRQQTLRSMIDWSWNLLTDGERTVLRRLAVSRDGCTLAGARAVCADGHDVLDVLSRLVDRSLVVREGERYRMLESVSAYCVEQLEGAGELEEVRRRFVAFHVREAERGDPLLRGSRQREALEWFDTETVNLRHALELAIRAGDADAALRLVNALTWYWRLRNRVAEARRSFEAALRLQGGSAHTRRVAEGRLAAFEGRPPREDGPVEAGALRLFWFAGSVPHDREAGRALVEEALARTGESGDRWVEAAALAERAGHRLDDGEVSASRADARRSAGIFLDLGDRWGLLRANAALARAAEADLDHRDVVALLEEDLRAAEGLGLWVDAIETLFRLGRIEASRGERSRARHLHERARRVAEERSYASGMVEADAWLYREDRVPAQDRGGRRTDASFSGGGPGPG